MVFCQSTESTEIWLLLTSNILQASWLQAMLKAMNWKTSIYFRSYKLLLCFSTASYNLEILSKNPQDRKIDLDMADIYLIYLKYMMVR